MTLCTCSVSGPLACPAHRGFYDPAAPAPLATCYHPGRVHGTCEAGHPIHHDTGTPPMWTHCTVQDLILCPYELAADPAGYQARHDSGAISG